MLKIDYNLLQDVGLSALPKNEQDDLLHHIYETLEMRVGVRLADQMTNEQLDEFETYFNAKDDAGAFRWLETNFPNYKDIVNEEFDKLKAEVQQSAPHILSASQQQAAVTPQAQPPQPTAPGYPGQQSPVQQDYQPQAQQPPQPAPQQGYAQESYAPPQDYPPQSPMPNYPDQPATPSQP